MTSELNAVRLITLTHALGTLGLCVFCPQKSFLPTATKPLGVEEFAVKVLKLARQAALARADAHGHRKPRRDARSERRPAMANDVTLFNTAAPKSPPCKWPILTSPTTRSPCNSFMFSPYVSSFTPCLVFKHSSAQIFCRVEALFHESLGDAEWNEVFRLL